MNALRKIEPRLEIATAPLPALPAKPRDLAEAEAALRAAREARAEIETIFKDACMADAAAGRTSPSEAHTRARANLDEADKAVVKARSDLGAARAAFGPDWRRNLAPIVGQAESDLARALDLAEAAAAVLSHVQKEAARNALPAPGQSKDAPEIANALALARRAARGGR